MAQQKDVSQKDILEALNKLDQGYHDTVSKWEKWFYEGNHPHIPPYMMPKSFDPEHNYADMVSQEIRDVEKQMSYIRSLENKLKDKNPDTDGNSHDWEMLSRLKKDLGLEVKYKTTTEKREEERAKRAGYTPPPTDEEIAAAKKAAEEKKAAEDKKKEGDAKKKPDAKEAAAKKE